MLYRIMSKKHHYVFQRSKCALIILYAMLMVTQLEYLTELCFKQLFLKEDENLRDHLCFQDKD